jgi:hypothetical protein
MHDEFDFFRAEDFFHRSLVAEVYLAQRNSRIHRAAMTIHEIVEDDGAVTRREQLTDTMTADVTGSPDDKHVHAVRLVLLSARPWLAISVP